MGQKRIERLTLAIANTIDDFVDKNPKLTCGEIYEAFAAILDPLVGAVAETPYPVKKPPNLVCITTLRKRESEFPHVVHHEEQQIDDPRPDAAKEQVQSRDESAKSSGQTEHPVLPRDWHDPDNEPDHCA